MRACVRACVRVCVSVGVRACVCLRACVRGCVRVYVCFCVSEVMTPLFGVTQSNVELRNYVISRQNCIKSSYVIT